MSCLTHNMISTHQKGIFESKPPIYSSRWVLPAPTGSPVARGARDQLSLYNNCFSRASQACGWYKTLVTNRWARHVRNGWRQNKAPVADKKRHVVVFNTRYKVDAHPIRYRVVDDRLNYHDIYV